MAESLFLILFAFVCGGVFTLTIRATVAFKRPSKCRNCGRRPRWAFDTSNRGRVELLRDHRKECEA